MFAVIITTMYRYVMVRILIPNLESAVRTVHLMAKNTDKVYVANTLMKSVCAVMGCATSGHHKDFGGCI